MKIKVGDLVEIVRRGKIGIVTSYGAHREIDGPNGDFFTEYWYNVLINGEVCRFRESSIVFVSSRDIS